MSDSDVAARNGAVRRLIRTLIGLVLVGGTAALVVWGFVEGRTEAAREKEREGPVKAPSRISLNDRGEPIVTLDTETQERSGIEVITPQQTRYEYKIRAYGAVLDLDKLTTLDNSYVTAVAQLQSAQAKLAASKAAFERTRQLYNTNAVPLAQVETNEATFRIDQAAVATADAQIRTLKTTAFEEWGPVIGKALVGDARLIARLLERETFLIQITLAPGGAIAPPPTIKIQLGDGLTRPEAQFVSRATQTDPKIQGLSYYYTASGDNGLLPGMSVLAFLPSGTPRAGIRIPASALVWWAGRPWVYFRAGPATFKRHPLPADAFASETGDLEVPVESLPQPTPQLVIAGAQMLLSEEFRAQIQVGEDGEK